MRLMRINLAVLCAVISMFVFAGEIGISQAAFFYVDSSRTANGDGSEINPWKNWTDINWSTISSSVATEETTIYFSSRDSWNHTDSFVVSTSGNISHTVNIIGNAKFNLFDSGDAFWQAETENGQKAILTNSGGSGGDLKLNNSTSYVSIRGFHIDHPIWGGVNLGNENPTVDIHHITLEEFIIDSPANNHGVWFGYAETGCSDIIIRNLMITNTPLECIYIGHYNYLPSTITGVIIEGNTCIDTGLETEGDIDIKPGVYGAIVRNNFHYRTPERDSGGNSGVVAAADAVQIYGNKFYGNDQKADHDWGFGIYLSADGDGTTGKTINSALIYNNLIYDNDRAGIKIGATKAGYTLGGVRIYNNTIASNGTYGVQITASGTTITVDDFKNNIITNNAGYDIYITNGVTMSSVENNLYHRSFGNSWWYHGSEKNWTQWQGLGFDPVGINADPLLNADYTLRSTSPAINSGLAIANFSIDKDGVSRPQGNAWDIGAYEYISSQPDTTPPAAPGELLIR